MGLNILKSQNNLSWLPTVTSVPAILALRVLPRAISQGTSQSPALVAQARDVVSGAAAEVVPRSMWNANRYSRFVGGMPFTINVRTHRVAVALFTAGTPPPKVMRNGASVPVCILWHARGQCFENCKILVDHGQLLTEEGAIDHCSISRIVAIRNCCFLLDYFKEVR
jgi:hypothetical protein